MNDTLRRDLRLAVFSGLLVATAWFAAQSPLRARRDRAEASLAQSAAVCEARESSTGDADAVAGLVALERRAAAYQRWWGRGRERGDLFARLSELAAEAGVTLDRVAPGRTRTEPVPDVAGAEAQTTHGVLVASGAWADLLAFGRLLESGSNALIITDLHMAPGPRGVRAEIEVKRTEVLGLFEMDYTRVAGAAAGGAGR